MCSLTQIGSSMGLEEISIVEMYIKSLSSDNITKSQIYAEEVI